MAGFRTTTIDDEEQNPDLESAIAAYVASNPDSPEAERWRALEARGTPPAMAKPAAALASMATGAAPKRIVGPTLTLAPGMSVGTYDAASAASGPTPEETQAAIPPPTPEGEAMLADLQAAGRASQEPPTEPALPEGHWMRRGGQAIASGMTNLARSVGGATARLLDDPERQEWWDAPGSNSPEPAETSPAPAPRPPAPVLSGDVRAAAPVATPPRAAAHRLAARPRSVSLPTTPAPDFVMQVPPTPFADEGEPAAPPGGTPPVVSAGPSSPPARPDPLDLAMKAAGQSRLIAALTRAGGTAIGRGTGPGYDALDANADRPMAELQMEQADAAKKAESDPNSPQSRAAWAVVEQLLPGGAKVPPEGRSAAQAKAMFPMFQEIIDREMAREQMRARSEEGRLNRAHEARLAGMRRGAGLGGAREADVQKLGKDTEGLAQVQNDLALLEKTISGTGDIPGAGVWDSKKPAFMQSGDDINIRQAAVRVAARLLHEQSGASVTPSEAERFMEGRGLGPGATEDQFRAGIQALASELRAALRAKAAKYRPEVVQTLQRRGGVVDLGAPPPAAGAPETRTVGGKRYERDADGQWYEVG
jgi:hypothetical protein